MGELTEKIKRFSARREQQVARGEAILSRDEGPNKKSKKQRLSSGRAAAKGLIDSTKRINKSLSRSFLAKLDADKKAQK